MIATEIDKLKKVCSIIEQDTEHFRTCLDRTDSQLEKQYYTGKLVEALSILNYIRDMLND